MSPGANAAPILEIERLLVQRAGRPVLEVEQLSIEEREVLAVIGPNGAGKTTLLLAIAQLLPLTRGEIRFRNQPLTPHQALAFRRRIALVLQEPLLLDTTVFENVAAGLKFRHFSKEQLRRRVKFWLEQLAIPSLSSRPARSLSGGEAQRVSLARAFALEPELLLLDEPFSALDAPTRLRLLEDLQALLASTACTTLFITHDLNEALLLGQRVAVMLNGQVRQVGSPREVFANPADPEIATFVGVETIIEGLVTRSHAGLVDLLCNGFHLAGGR